jgi:hypothetical protein
MGIPVQIFEVRVILMGSNVAVGKDVSQSTDFKGKARYAASKVVDDDENSFSHILGVDVAFGGRSIWETRSLLSPSRF